MRREDVAERVADLPLAEDFELARSVLAARGAHEEADGPILDVSLSACCEDHCDPRIGRAESYDGRGGVPIHGLPRRLQLLPHEALTQVRTRPSSPGVLA